MGLATDLVLFAKDAGASGTTIQAVAFQHMQEVSKTLVTFEGI